MSAGRLPFWRREGKMTQALASDSAVASPAPGEQQSGLGPPASSAPPTRTHPPRPAHLLQHPRHRQQRGHHWAPPGVRAPVYTQPVLASFLEQARLRAEVPGSSTEFVREGGLGSGSHAGSSCPVRLNQAQHQGRLSFRKPSHLPERKLADSEVVIPTRIHLSPGRAPAATFQAFPGHPKCHWVPSPPTRRAFRKTCARRLGGPQTGVCRRSPPNTIPVTTVALTLPSHPPCPGTGPSTKGTGSRRGRARPTVLSGAPGGAAPGSPAPGSGPSHWTTG